MSFWSHNIEKYEELQRQAIVQLLRKSQPILLRSTNDDDIEEYLGELIDNTDPIQSRGTIGYVIYQILAHQSHKEFLQREREYFGNLIDSQHPIEKEGK